MSTASYTPNGILKFFNSYYFLFKTSNDFLDFWPGIFFRNLSIKFWIEEWYKIAPELTQAEFYRRTVIHTMPCAETYGTDHTGLRVRPAAAIANGSRLSYQMVTGCYRLSNTEWLWWVLTLIELFCATFPDWIKSVCKL